METDVHRLRPNYTKRLSADRRGGILTLTAVLLPVVILIAALCVDLGVLYLAQSKTEAAAILAAEAGERRLSVPAEAEAIAQSFAQTLLHDAGFAQEYRIDTSVESGRITVSVELEMRTALAHFIDVPWLSTGSVAVRPLP